MRKGTYRAVEIKDAPMAKVKQATRGQRVVFAIDMAKEVPVGRVVTEHNGNVVTVKWKQPSQTMEVVAWLGQLEAREVEIALEPTGTYGTPLRAHLEAGGYKVYRVNPKRVHDAGEVYDGVPSKHDAKDAAVIAELHLRGASEPWPLKTEDERELRAAVRQEDYYEERFGRSLGQLEALLAEHWPELGKLMDLDSATLLALLARYGSAQEVARNEAEARELMRQRGGHLLKAEKIEAVLQAARNSTGLEPVSRERSRLQGLCTEMQRDRELAQQAARDVLTLVREDEALSAMSTAVGKGSAAGLKSELGAPKNYGKGRQYLKAAGLNVKEKSSGKNKGPAHITKRGSSVARRLLYLAAMRMVKDNPVVRAWYESKLREPGSARVKALVAVMRKLALAVWHLGVHGGVFDASRLFDTRKLGIAGAAAAAAGS